MRAGAAESIERLRRRRAERASITASREKSYARPHGSTEREADW